MPGATMARMWPSCCGLLEGLILSGMRRIWKDRRRKRLRRRDGLFVLSLWFCSLSQREGGTLTCAPSAVADAGNGPPLMRRSSADADAGNGRPLSYSLRSPSADAVAGRGNRGELPSGALQQLDAHVIWRLDKGNPDTGSDGPRGHGEDGATLG